MKLVDSRIKIFDAVRAGATIAVFIFHAGYLLNYPHQNFIHWQRFEYFAGTVGVSAFFVLSAFLLFYQLYKNNEPLNKDKLKTYSKKRLLRILPLYYFSLIFIVIFIKNDLWFSSLGLRSIFYNLFFLRGIKGAGGGGTIAINPVYWSLVVEMHFYFILPVIYYLFYKYKKPVIFVIFALLGIAYRSALVLWTHPTNQIMRLTPANFDFFAFGMLGAYLYVNRRKWVDYLGKTYIQLGSFVLLLSFIYFYDLEFLPTISYVFAPTFLGLIIAFSMLSFLVNEKSISAKILTTRPMLFLAKISFSVYVWHAVIITWVDGFYVPNGIKFLLDIVFTIAFSTLTYYIIEAPFLKMSMKKFQMVEQSPEPVLLDRQI